MVNAYDPTSIFSHVGIILLFIYDRDPHILSPLEHRKNQREDSPPVKVLQVSPGLPWISISSINYFHKGMQS